MSKVIDWTMSMSYLYPPSAILHAWNTVVAAWKEIEAHGYATKEEFEACYPARRRIATREENHSFYLLDRAHMKYPYQVAAGE